jgi:hypothetical protein
MYQDDLANGQKSQHLLARRSTLKLQQRLVDNKLVPF